MVNIAPLNQVVGGDYQVVVVGGDDQVVVVGGEVQVVVGGEVQVVVGGDDQVVVVEGEHCIMDIMIRKKYVLILELPLQTGEK